MRKTEQGNSAGGFAFVAALLVMLVLAILITGVLTMAIAARNLSSSRHEYNQALYVAEIGVNQLLSVWRKAGAAPAQPYQGTVNLDGATGSYRVTWANWEPEPGIVREDVWVITSRGTVNTGLQGTIYNLTRTIQVNVDTDGDWAWNHVFASDDPDPAYQLPPYADIRGNSGTVTPESYLHENGPSKSAQLPTPKWDEWEAKAASYDTLPYPSIYTGNKLMATESRHVYWYGQNEAAHNDTSHTHYNYFTPDPYFPSLSYPSAYVCDPMVIEFKKQSSPEYTGVYFVHGDIIIKSGVTITGTLVATRDIIFQGTAGVTIKILIENADDCASRTVYPALIAGRDILIRDQAVFHTEGIIWAGRTFMARAADQAGCIVAPHIELWGNFSVSYGFDTTNPACPRYEPGDSPPPMFNEPDKGAMRPMPRAWREL